MKERGEGSKGGRREVVVAHDTWEGMKAKKYNNNNTKKYNFHNDIIYFISSLFLLSSLSVSSRHHLPFASPLSTPLHPHLILSFSLLLSFLTLIIGRG